MAAKIGVDTAESEPLKNRLVFKRRDLTFADPSRPRHAAALRFAAALRALAAGDGQRHALPRLLLSKAGTLLSVEPRGPFDSTRRVSNRKRVNDKCGSRN